MFWGFLFLVAGLNSCWIMSQQQRCENTKKSLATQGNQTSISTVPGLTGRCSTKWATLLLWNFAQTGVGKYLFPKRSSKILKKSSVTETTAINRYETVVVSLIQMKMFCFPQNRVTVMLCMQLVHKQCRQEHFTWKGIAGMLLKPNTVCWNAPWYDTLFCLHFLHEVLLTLHFMHSIH